jgi:hypothetical protein
MVGRVLRPHPGKADALVIDHAGAVFEHGFVDEPIIWTLDEDKRAENPKQTARQKKRMPSLTECPECKAIRMQGQPCGSCGWRPKPKPAPVDIRDGDLAAVTRAGIVAPGREDELSFYRQLLYVAQQRGYSQGWAFHKHVEKFKSKPQWAWRNATPIEPAPATLSWIRSRQIAWAKSRAA